MFSLNQDLQKSIQRFGVLQPVVAKKDGEVIIGQRRSEIAKRLGLEIPVIIRDDLSDEVAAFEARLSEEMSHHAWEELALAEEVRKVFEAHKKRDKNFRQVNLAQRVGTTTEKVSKYLTLAGLPDEVKERVADQELSAHDAFVISGIADLTDRQKAKLAKKVADEKIPGGRKLIAEVAPFIRRAPEPVRKALIENPKATYWDVQRHVEKQEERKEKAAKQSKEVGSSLRGLVAKVEERLRYWAGAMLGIRQMQIAALCPDDEWPDLEKSVRNLIDECQKLLDQRTKKTVAEAERMIEARPDKVIDMVEKAGERWEATSDKG